MKQISTEAGFLIDGETKTIAIESGAAQTLTVYNKPTQSLTVRLFVKGTETPIAGAKFLLTDGSGTKLGNADGEFITDETGRFSIGGLTPGSTVKVEQVSTAAGFLPDAETKVVTIQSGDAQTVTMYNTSTQGLTVQLYAEGTSQPIPGARFYLTDSNGVKLGAENGEFKTDRNGRFSLTDLAPGLTVKVKQISSADGFLIDSDTHTIAIKSGDVQTVTVYNAPQQTFTVQLYVKGTTTPIPGARFLLTDGPGAKLGDEDGEFTTDEAGRFTLNGLTPGMTVKVKQISTTGGYLLDSAPKSVTIKAGNEQTVTVYNSPVQTLTIRLYVKDTTTPIAGAKFLLRDSGGALIGENNGVFTTDQHGEFSISGLTPGITITAMQTDTVSGYVLDGNPQSILIKSGTAQSLTYYNAPKGALVVRKIDAVTERPLEGAEFKILTIGGAPVDDYEGKTSTNGIYRTDENGEITLLKLAPGVYTVTEMKAPAGYVLDSQTQGMFCQGVYSRIL